jgi:hypothetical protein
MVSALTGSWQSLWLIHHRFVLLPLNLYASWVLHVHLALQLPCIALYASHDTGYKGSIRSRIPWYRRLNGYGFDPGSHGILQFFGPEAYTRSREGLKLCQNVARVSPGGVKGLVLDKQNRKS